jgi:TfoX/Sxy family transcriptional regulator of competence genes
MADMLARLHETFDPLGAVNKKMFGGTCFMLNGNMIAGTSNRGLLVRTGKDFDAIAASRDDCQIMEMSGKSMAGYWYVSNSIDDATFVYWMDVAFAHNKTLPAK